ncbi:MAG: hypothetical protein ACLGH8_06215 [Bacteroidia bacterium]
MKRIAILIFLLSAMFSSTAQDLEYLKAQDTIYLVLPNVFTEKAINSKFEKFSLSIDCNGMTTYYTFTDIDTVTQYVFIGVNLNRHKPDPKLSVPINRRKFLKKNKKRILGLDVISKYRNEEFFFSYLGARAFAPSSKIIYVIDEESLKRKDKKIQLMRATLTTMGYLKI